MDIPYPELILLGLLTLINAFFTGSEIAFVSLRDGQVQRLSESGERGKVLAALAQNPNRFLSTCQIWITLLGFVASAVAAVSLAEPLQPLLGFLGRAAAPVSVLLVTVILAYFTLVLGELAPKRIALQRAEGWALFAARPLYFMSQLARPVVWLLEISTNVIVRFTGNDPNRQREEVSEAELRDMLETQDTFTDDQRSIIAGAFEIADRTLREILVPRGQVVAVENTVSAQEAIHTMAEAGHSRAPMHTGDLDDVLGIIHMRDLINHNGPAQDRVRAATVLPESVQVLDALRRMQTSRQQMAIVVNEHGGVEGIVTVEDLLEEIVGEIYDEFDRVIVQAQTEADGSVVLPGSFPIHDLEDVGIELPDGDGAYATIAGYVLDQLGHIPVAGEAVDGERYRIEVLQVEERAITKLRVTPVEPPSDEEG